MKFRIPLSSSGGGGNALMGKKIAAFAIKCLFVKVGFNEDAKWQAPGPSMRNGMVSFKTFRMVWSSDIATRVYTQQPTQIKFFL